MYPEQKIKFSHLLLRRSSSAHPEKFKTKEFDVKAKKYTFDFTLYYEMKPTYLF